MRVSVHDWEKTVLGSLAEVYCRLSLAAMIRRALVSCFRSDCTDFLLLGLRERLLDAPVSRRPEALSNSQSLQPIPDPEVL